MGTSIFYAHQLLGHGSRGWGQWHHLAAQQGLGEGEDTNMRLWLPSELSNRHMPSPNSHITPWCCECLDRMLKPLLPTGAMGLAGCHIAPTCLAQSSLLAGEGWQDGEGSVLSPRSEPQLDSLTCHYGVTNVMSGDGEQLWMAKMEIKMEQLSVANWQPLRRGRKEGTSLILVCYCFYKKHLLTVAGRVMSVSTEFLYLFFSLPYWNNICSQ